MEAILVYLGTLAVLHMQVHLGIYLKKRFDDNRHLVDAYAVNGRHANASRNPLTQRFHFLLQVLEPVEDCTGVFIKLPPCGSGSHGPAVSSKKLRFKPGFKVFNLLADSRLRYVIAGGCT